MTSSVSGDRPPYNGASGRPYPTSWLYVYVTVVVIVWVAS